jgi:hypothetical protein
VNRLPLRSLCALLGVFNAGCQLLFPLDGYSGGGDAGGPSCGAAFLCDGFESDAPWWNLKNESDGGQVELSTVHPHRGAQSLHATTSSSTSGLDSSAYLRHVQTVPGLFYARVFIWIPSPALSGAPWFLAATENSDQFRGISIGVSAGHLATNDWGNSPVAYHVASADLPLDRWVCVEWMVDATAQETRVWQEGNELPELHTTGLVVPPYGWFRAGIDVTTVPGEHYEVWLDDLWVDTQPVGCDR